MTAPGHQVIAYKDPASALYALRCDPSACPHIPPAIRDRKVEPRLPGTCTPAGCYLGASLSPEGRETMAERAGFDIVKMEG